MSAPSIEQRLEDVEKTVRDLQRLVGGKEPDPNWLDRFIGSMDQFPEFEDVVRYGREFRESVTDLVVED